MTYTQKDKLTALAIVSIFETGRPMGRFAALAVLRDGAGISYGISQFTHRSGSLLAVVRNYLERGGTAGAATLRSATTRLMDASPRSIAAAAADPSLKGALILAAATPEMRAAQLETAEQMYLTPAIDECRRRAFTAPLSLAVVYDSMNHGGYERIASLVRAANIGGSRGEKAWILEYLGVRRGWLARSRTLAPTVYRPNFFLNEIGRGNWQLNLPLTVHGCRLVVLPDLASAGPSDARTGWRVPAPQTVPDAAPQSTQQSPAPPQIEDPPSPPKTDAPAAAVEATPSIAERFDAATSRLDAVGQRTDSVKSLWTTVGGTLWQAVWAVVGFAAGIPVEIWIIVAVIAGVLMLAYLYRQIEMGRIREQRAAKG